MLIERSAAVFTAVKLAGPRISSSRRPHDPPPARRLESVGGVGGLVLVGLGDTPRPHRTPGVSNGPGGRPLYGYR
jgi:hypothetical protein